MKGKIVKAVAGFYYVDVDKDTVYQCRARGIFRNRNVKPLIGDNVRIEVTHEGDMEGNVLEIYPRKNSLVRPTVANIDQAVIVFALAFPDPNLNLLDRFLVVVSKNGITPLVCFNKSDLVSESKAEEIVDIYKKAGYQVLVSTAKFSDTLPEFERLLSGKTTVFAGPSGVGKSTIINLLQQHTYMETGIVSEKIKRGKHTTRHANLIPIDLESYVVDTPGFSSLSLDDMEAADLKEHFLEFLTYEPYCKFNGCNHVNEPSCGVKDAVLDGDISQSRYDSYLQIYDELANIRRY